ncbi:MAG: fasciclin domain-containing protein [Lacinutrix venerupis]
MKIKNYLKTGVFTLSLLITVGVFAQEKVMRKDAVKKMKKEKMMKEKTVMVGGAAMYPSKNIVENAVNSEDHTTLVAAVKAAELVDVLAGEGPFTVFAPTNEAFAKLPEGTVDTLLKPENKEALQTVLTYHVVEGKWNTKEVLKMIKRGNGKAEIKTVSGGTITVWLKGEDVYISDANGNSAMVTIANVNQSNGVIHVIDTVLLPKS